MGVFCYRKGDYIKYKASFYDVNKKKNYQLGWFRTEQEANDAIEYFLNDNTNFDFSQYISSEDLCYKFGVSQQRLGKILLAHPKLPRTKNRPHVMYLINGVDSVILDHLISKTTGLELGSGKEIRRRGTMFSLPPIEQFREVAKEHREKSEKFWG